MVYLTMEHHSSLREKIDGGSFKNILVNNGKGNIKRFSEGLIFHVPYENIN